MPALGYNQQFVPRVCVGLFSMWRKRPAEHLRDQNFIDYCTSIGVDYKSLAFRFNFNLMQDIEPKRQTIRAMRKRPFKEGDMLYHYYGLRTKQCRKLGESICKSAVPITLMVTGVYVDGKLLSDRAVGKLATADGFTDFYEMYHWFKSTHGLPFKGQLIKW